MRRNMTKKEKQESRADALRMAVENYGIKPGSVIYYHIDSVSRSGMSRVISFYIAKDSEISDITHILCRVLGYPRTDNAGLKISGCGMNMGFYCISSLGRALWPDGTPEPHGMRNGHSDNAGEYALKYRSL